MAQRPKCSYHFVPSGAAGLSLAWPLRSNRRSAKPGPPPDAAKQELSRAHLSLAVPSPMAPERAPFQQSHAFQTWSGRAGPAASLTAASPCPAARRGRTGPGPAARGRHRQPGRSVACAEPSHTQHKRPGPIRVNRRTRAAFRHGTLPPPSPPPPHSLL